MGRWVNSRSTWAGHVERMGEFRLPRRACVQQGKGRVGDRRRPNSWWLYCTRTEGYQESIVEHKVWRTLAEHRRRCIKVVYILPNDVATITPDPGTHGEQKMRHDLLQSVKYVDFGTIGCQAMGLAVSRSSASLTCHSCKR